MRYSSTIHHHSFRPFGGEFGWKAIFRWNKFIYLILFHETNLGPARDTICNMFRNLYIIDGIMGSPLGIFIGMERGKILIQTVLIWFENSLWYLLKTLSHNSLHIERCWSRKLSKWSSCLRPKPQTWKVSATLHILDHFWKKLFFTVIWVFSMALVRIFLVATLKFVCRFY